MIRILHVDTGRAIRGGQELLLATARGLRARGNVQAIACIERGELEAAARDAGFETLPARLGAMRAFLRAHACDIAHSHDAGGQTLAWLASLGTGVKRIATRQVQFVPRHPFIHRLKYTYTCHRVIARSEAVRDVLLAAGVPAAHVAVLGGGIEIPEALPTPDVRARWRGRMGFAEGDFVIGHAGAFTAEKGQAVALRALLRLRTAHPDARLVLAGDGPLRSAPEMLALLEQAAGIAAAPGFVRDLTDFLAGCDLFVMPSLSEAFGLAPLHAMANGVPVIASDTGGLRAIVADGETGWLVPPGDDAALAEAIEAAMRDRPRLRQFAAAGIERARLFGIGPSVEKLEALYREVIAESK